MKRYAEYDFTNLKWFPLKPTHWELRPAKSVFALRNEKEREGDVHLTPSQTYGVLPQAEYMRVTGSRVVLALAGTTMKHVEPDDFVIHLRSFQGGIELSRFRGKVSPAYTVLIPEGEAFPGYFRYVLKAPGYVQTIASLTDQLRDGQTMRYSDFGKVPLVVPPLEEQRAIADFLDRETAEIDAFIADQERLIELLTERRTATITHAVTKGLDPSAPMRDSGIPWLGHIPAHWNLVRFSHLATINSGQVDPRSADYRDMVLIAPNHVESWTGKIKYTETAAEQGADSGKYYARKGQVIFSKIRPTLMKTVIAPADVLCSADMYAISGSNRFISNEYLANYLRSTPFHDYARDQSMRVAMPKLNHETLNAAVIPVPPRSEQDDVVREVADVASELDSLIDDAKRAIELSKERRAALISAAVTGQIDVRTHA